STIKSNAVSDSQSPGPPGRQISLGDPIDAPHASEQERGIRLNQQPQLLLTGFQISAHLPCERPKSVSTALMSLELDAANLAHWRTWRFISGFIESRQESC